jgi:hypothetical protein
MMWEWLQNVIKEPVETWTQPVEDGIAAMSVALKSESEIRIYVDNTPNFGNQASSILLMKTLIDQYQYDGDDKKVTILYKKSGADETRQKLSILLEGFDNTKQDATAKYSDVTINFMTIEALNASKALGDIRFGFAGGADEGDGDDDKNDNWFAKNCKVNFFLRLQAYLWPYPQQIQFGEQSSEEVTFDLNANIGGGSVFEKTGWFILDKYWKPQEKDWTYYVNDKNPGVDAGTVCRTELVKVLVDFIINNPDALKLMPVYGIKEFPNQTGVVPWAALSCVIATALGGSQELPNKIPTVVVSLNNDMGDSDFANAYYISRAEETPYEIDAEDSFKVAKKNRKKYEKRLKKQQEENEKDQKEINKTEKKLAEAIKTESSLLTTADEQKKVFKQRKKWFEKRNSPDGIKFASSKSREVFLEDDSVVNMKVNPEELLNALNTLIDPNTSKPAVLFLELGPLPTILFNYLFSLASFPNVFEGANSANLSLNLGKCYLRMENPQKQTKINRYPEPSVLDKIAYTKIQKESTAAADGLLKALFSSSKNPASEFDKWIGHSTAYIKQYYVTQEKDLLAYYEQLEKFYHNKINDKLGIGLSCMNQAVINDQLSKEEV